MKKKMALNELKVKSFITPVSEERADTAKGGWIFPTNAIYLCGRSGDLPTECCQHVN